MKVEFFWTENGSETQSEIEEVDDNLTDAELQEMAKDYFFNDKEPEWWHRKIIDKID